MVSLKEVRASNQLFAASSDSNSLVAVFVGATSGIGLGTLRVFTLNAQSPKIYILGRSLSAFTPNLTALQLSNPAAIISFIETEISLIRNIDTACATIKAQEEKVDILFMSPGLLNFGSRNETVEGIDIPHALRYFSRLRFTYNLLPLLKASTSPRVVSILGGGMEKEFDTDDIEVRKDFTAMKAARAGTTLTTLAFKHLSESHKTVSFLHVYPGLVATNAVPTMLSSTTGFFYLPAMILRYTVLPIINLFVGMSINEAGERGLYMSTSSRFETGGVYRVDAKNEFVEEEGEVLRRYREEGVQRKISVETVKVWVTALERGASE